VQNAVAQVLGKKVSSVTVENKRVGGAYGAKITRNILPFCAVAFAADQLGVPVRMHMDLTTNLNMIDIFLFLLFSFFS
jgi:xanthine dehydrogenase/oxidase